MRVEKKDIINQSNKYSCQQISLPRVFLAPAHPAPMSTVAMKKYQQRESARLYKELKKNPCQLESLQGIRLCNGPHCIFMISTKRSVYALFHVKNMNKYHLSSTVQKLKEIKIGSK